MTNAAKVFPASSDLVETTFNEQEIDQEFSTYPEYQVPPVMTFSKRKALSDFRSKLEDAIQNNYIFEKETSPFIQAAKDPEYLMDLSLWGVPLLPSKGHEATDIVLEKFLEATHFKISESLNLLQKTLIWRMKKGIEGILNEKFDTDLEEVGRIGNNKGIKGHSLCYNVYGIYKKKDTYKERFESYDKYEDFRRWNIQFMERCVQTLDFRPGGTNSIILIIDVKDAPAPLIKELPTFDKKMLILLRNYYPGIIYRQIIINVPLWLLTFHALQLLPLTKRTNKFIFVRPLRVTKTLLKFIAPENLPVEYGGLEQENSESSQGNGKVVLHKVRPGTVERFLIPVPQAGVTVFWDLTVVGFEVSYKEEFIPSDDCSYRILIQKEHRLEKYVRNSFYVREPGNIFLSIENATYKTKRAFCRHWIQSPVNP
ncbi:CRAL-TRIO lipid binding [Heracleum sosnowskyi]|uniref:CRAL-TRIO lipid binding n=1 Tax=Heracleum sosnowskyi TaxID=360622 RepID=A0AAD8J8P3_9APIA|nr:CRAL-TRIO lipid binding [Heracleum sosnowskyi]